MPTRWPVAVAKSVILHYLQYIHCSSVCELSAALSENDADYEDDDDDTDDDDDVRVTDLDDVSI